MSDRFSVGRDEGHLVIRDNERGGRAVIAFLPNDRKPDAPLNMASVCVKALNEATEIYRKRRHK